MPQTLLRRIHCNLRVLFLHHGYCLKCISLTQALCGMFAIVILRHFLLVKMVEVTMYCTVRILCTCASYPYFVTYHVVTLISRLVHIYLKISDLISAFFLTPRSKNRNQSLQKAEEDLFFSCRYIYVHRQNALGESPRTHVSPNPPSPAPQNSFYSFPSPKRKDEKGGNWNGGE